MAEQKQKKPRQHHSKDYYTKYHKSEFNKDLNAKPDGRTKKNNFKVKISDKEIMKTVSEDVERNIINCDLELFDLPPIDTGNLSQVEARFREYLDIVRKYGLKTSVESFALALGLTVPDLKMRIMSGKMSISCNSFYKKAISYLNSDLWANTQEGKTNPVTAIFLSKNHFGYKDQTEQKITVENVNGNAEDARTKYLADPQIVDVRPQELGNGSAVPDTGAEREEKDTVKEPSKAEKAKR